MDFDKFEEVREDSQSEQMVFHYSREERVKKAPSLVKQYYEGTFKAYKPGIFKALVQTRANRFMFFTLIVCFIVVVFLGIFNRRNEAALGNIPLKLSAFSFEETVYVSLEFEKSAKFEGLVNAAVEVDYLGTDKEIVDKQVIIQDYDGKQAFLRTTLHDYDIVNVEAVVLINDKSVKLKAPVEKR